MTDISISRDPAPATTDFHSKVQDGRDETTEVPGGYGSMPYIYTVTIEDSVFYGFDSGLPADREPWFAGFRPITRDEVIDAETLETVTDEAIVDLVNHVISTLADDVNHDETVVDALDDGANINL